MVAKRRWLPETGLAAGYRDDKNDKNTLGGGGRGEKDDLPRVYLAAYGQKSTRRRGGWGEQTYSREICTSRSCRLCSSWSRNLTSSTSPHRVYRKIFSNLSLSLSLLRKIRGMKPSLLPSFVSRASRVRRRRLLALGIANDRLATRDVTYVKRDSRGFHSLFPTLCFFRMTWTLEEAGCDAGLRVRGNDSLRVGCARKLRRSAIFVCTYTCSLRPLECERAHAREFRLGR